MIQHKIILGTDLFHLNAIVCYTKLVNINFDKYFTCFIALLVKHCRSVACPGITV